MDAWTVALDFRALLGEGLHWDAQRGVLWFVDIHGQRIACWQPGDLRWQEWLAPQKVSWIIPTICDETLMVGFQQGVARVDLSGELRFEWVCRMFADAPQLRLNDAKADVSGALWAGSLNNDDEGRLDGALFRVDAATKQTTAIDTGYRVANGPAIHPGGQWMLHTDSGRRTIYAFDLDVERGQAMNRRVWKVLADADGYPDGMTFDAEGCLWLAHWGAGCVSRYTADGLLLRRVQLPTSHISNVCFGGHGLDRLFVTSARVGLTATQLASQPQAGALFEIDAMGVVGLPGLPARV